LRYISQNYQSSECNAQSTTRYNCEFCVKAAADDGQNWSCVQVAIFITVAKCHNTYRRMAFYFTCISTWKLYSRTFRERI